MEPRVSVSPADRTRGDAGAQPKEPRDLQVARGLPIWSSAKCLDINQKQMVERQECENICTLKWRSLPHGARFSLNHGTKVGVQDCPKGKENTKLVHPVNASIMRRRLPEGTISRCN